MADHPDFAALYYELGVDPHCTPEQLRNAYRRCVSRLHPDHTGREDDMPRLQRLNRLYAAANEFQRRHGRLPGARRSDARASEAPSAIAPRIASAEMTPPLSGSQRIVRYLLPVAVAVVALSWWWAPAGPDAAVDRRDSLAAPVGSDSVLRLGMERARVKRIQGMAVNANANRWDYGPSWIEFDCGRVIDWYSSPSRPLRVDQHGPAMSGDELASSNKIYRCAH